MDRIKFIKTCGLACLSITGMTYVSACTQSSMINAKISGSDIVFPLSDFETIKKNVKQYKKYLIIHNEKLKYPICVFRSEKNEYTALLMQCTHQGAELQVFGDKLQCPAHGSEFDNKGIVQSSPANKDLRTFPIKIDNNNIKISLA